MLPTVYTHSHGQPPRADQLNTRFTTDILGRYLCNTLEEASVAAFDAVVIGAGMAGATLATDLNRFLNERARFRRLLLLDAGGLLLPSHCQNLPFHPQDDPMYGVRDWPWTTTDHGYHSEACGLALCLGGRSLFWGGWAPRLLEEDFRQPGQEWPLSLDDLLPHYQFLEQRLGVNDLTPFACGGLQDTLRARLESSADPDLQRAGTAPLAIQGCTSADLFSNHKFSVVPLLIDTVRHDVHQHRRSGGDANARLMMVPFWRAIRLEVAPEAGEHRVTGILVARRLADGSTQARRVPVKPDGIVALACSTIEAARLCLASPEFPNPNGQIGRNLMLHLRADLACNWEDRSQFAPDASHEIGIAALLVRGQTSGPRGRPLQYHLQIESADFLADSRLESFRGLFQVVPDADALQRMLDTRGNNPVAGIIRGVGEMKPNDDTYMDLAPGATDAFGVPLARIQLRLDGEAQAVRNAMATAMQQAAAAIQPTNTGGVFHWPAGTSHDEAGTLAMGQVTDAYGRIYGTRNAYVAGPALFPSVGSANPSLSAMALARRTALHLAEEVL